MHGLMSLFNFTNYVITVYYNLIRYLSQKTLQVQEAGLYCAQKYTLDTVDRSIVLQS